MITIILLKYYVYIYIIIICLLHIYIIINIMIIVEIICKMRTLCQFNSTVFRSQTDYIK